MDNIKNITDFLNVEYLEYSRYTVEDRAIPSVCDGLKPGARKIFHGANTGTIKDGLTHKLLVLSGDTMNKSQYAHGDASLNGTIAEKAKDFVNNLNGLEIEGQGGSLRNPDAVGSPRYLYIRKSKYMDMIYKADYDLVEYVFDEGMYLEPTHYLPIIPTVLTSLAMGIANGYSFHSMAYNPIDIIDYCINDLKSGKAQINIHPYLRGISNDTWKYIDGHWFSFGKWKFNQSKDLMTITDLPSDVTYEDFETLLNKYIDSNYIKDYANKSENGNILYEIQFPTKQLSIELKKQKDSEFPLANKFKLIKQVPDDLLWVLDENHKLKYFANIYDLIHYFINWRLSIYQIKKTKLTKILEERYKVNCDLIKFIELICKGKLKIRNRSKVDIKVDMDAEKLPMSLISTPMSKCTIEECDELLKENESIKSELEYIRKTSTTNMYIDDLNKLKENLSKDFQTNYSDKTIEVKVEGEAKKTSSEREIEKIKKQKAKEKANREKEKLAKQRDKEKANREKEKLTKQRAKEKAMKEKERLAKQRAKEKAMKEKQRLAKQRDKEKLEKLKNK